VGVRPAGKNPTTLHASCYLPLFYPLKQMPWYLRAFLNRVVAVRNTIERLFRPLDLDYMYRIFSQIATMLTSRQISRNLNGIPTEIVMQAFADRILVLITQMGKVGTLVHLIHQRWIEQ